MTLELLDFGAQLLLVHSRLRLAQRKFFHSKKKSVLLLSKRSTLACLHC